MASDAGLLKFGTRWEYRPQPERNRAESGQSLHSSSRLQSRFDLLAQRLDWADGRHQEGKPVQLLSI